MGNLLCCCKSGNKSRKNRKASPAARPSEESDVETGHGSSQPESSNKQEERKEARRPGLLFETTSELEGQGSDDYQHILMSIGTFASNNTVSVFQRDQVKTISLVNEGNGTEVLHGEEAVQRNANTCSGIELWGDCPPDPKTTWIDVKFRLLRGGIVKVLAKDGKKVFKDKFIVNNEHPIRNIKASINKVSVFERRSTNGVKFDLLVVIRWKTSLKRLRSWISFFKGIAESHKS